MRGLREAAIVGVVVAIGAHLGADALDAALLRVPLSNDALAAIAVVATAHLAAAMARGRHTTPRAVTMATVCAVASIEAVAHLVAGHSLTTALAVASVAAVAGGAVVVAVTVVDRVVRRAAFHGSPPVLGASTVERLAAHLDVFVISPVAGSATLRGPPASSH